MKKELMLLNYIGSALFWDSTSSINMKIELEQA